MKKDTIQTLSKLMEGKKTYACAFMVIAVGAAFKAGLIDAETAFSMTALFLGLMGASTRSAIGKGGK